MNGLNGGIFIVLRVFRQQFIAAELPIWIFGDDIGKCATAINPKFPALLVIASVYYSVDLFFKLSIHYYITIEELEFQATGLQ